MGTVPSKAIRLAACPLLGMFDNARWSMNGTTIQSVSGDLDTIGQLQLRMRGSRESQDTNGALGADSLRQHMGHPTSAPQTSALVDAAALAGAGATSRYHSADGVYANDKHKLCTDRCADGVAVNKSMELMTPVSMALTSWGINKFISGASHDLRFTIGQHGIDGKKSFYTRAIPGSAADSGTVLAGTALTGNGVAIDDARSAAQSFNILNATTAATNANVARTVAQFQPTIPAYAAAAAGLKITVRLF